MPKIVYNVCYGGFSLSREAILLARELSGDPNWGGPCIKGDTRPSGHVIDRDYGYIDVERHDPVLVSVVEILGEKASGRCADLCLEYVDSGTLYYIKDYDGWEEIVTEVDHKWIMVP